MELKQPDRRHPVQRARDLAKKLTDAIDRENAAKEATAAVMNEINSLSGRAEHGLVIRFIAESTQALLDESIVPKKAIEALEWLPLPKGPKVVPPPRYSREKSQSNWRNHELNKILKGKK